MIFDRKKNIIELFNSQRELLATHSSLIKYIAKKAGLNNTDIECINYIIENKTATAGELAILTGLTTGAVTTVIKRITGTGMIKSKADPNDKRSLILSPATLPGLNSPIAKVMKNTLKATLSSYTKEEMEIITRHNKNLVKKMTELRENLDKIEF